jgi:hypothetical protein
VALSIIVGIPKGLSLSESGFGIHTRLIRFGLYFLGCVTTNLNSAIALNLSLGLFHKILSTPGVLRPSLVETLRTANARNSKDIMDLYCISCNLVKFPFLYASTILVWLLDTYLFTLIQLILCHCIE